MLIRYTAERIATCEDLWIFTGTKQYEDLKTDKGSMFDFIKLKSISVISKKKSNLKRYLIVEKPEKWETLIYLYGKK